MVVVTAAAAATSASRNAAVLPDKAAGMMPTVDRGDGNVIANGDETSYAAAKANTLC